MRVTKFLCVLIALVMMTALIGCVMRDDTTNGGGNGGGGNGGGTGNGSTGCPTSNYILYSDTGEPNYPTEIIQLYGGYAADGVNSTITAQDGTSDGASSGTATYLRLTDTNAADWAAGGWSRCTTVNNPACTNPTGTVNLSCYGALNISLRSNSTSVTEMILKMEDASQEDGMGSEITQAVTPNGGWQDFCVNLSEFTGNSTNPVNLTNLRALFVYVLPQTSPAAVIDVDEIFFTPSECSS